MIKFVIQLEVVLHAIPKPLPFNGQISEQRVQAIGPALIPNAAIKTTRHPTAEYCVNVVPEAYNL